MATKIGDPFFAFTYTNDIKGSHSIEVCYFATFAEDLAHITLQPDDHSEFGWFAENELHAATSSEKGLEDIEFVAIKKGFALLRGERPEF